jgi:hypothetical protein
MIILRLLTFLLLLWLNFWGFVTSLLSSCTHKVLRVLTVTEEDWGRFVIAIVFLVLFKAYTLDQTADATKKLEERNAKLEADLECSFARRTIGCMYLLPVLNKMLTSYG